MNKVVIIGAGAAGLMAGIAAAENGAEVTILEKNDRAGKKIRITGKGRCNVTSAKSLDEHIKAFAHNGKFMYTPYSALSPEEIYSFFEEAGVPLKVERGDRVFPQSDNAQDIVDALVKKCESLGAKIVYDKAVKTLLRSAEGELLGILCADGERISADKVIIATGGASYPGTGSSGDGYKLAKSAGHTIEMIRPALVPLVVKEDDIAKLQGLSLRNVRLSIYDKKGKCLAEEFGEMLFTHFGLSGPVVLTVSGKVSDYFLKQNGELMAIIDLKPALSAEKLDARLLREIKDQPKRSYKNLLGALLPQLLIEPFMKRSGIEPMKQSNPLTKEDRAVIIDLLKGYWFTVTATRPLAEGIVTAGGVNVKEIMPKTMQSRLCEGLYFAGEVMDIDAVTGGFNLQAAFSSGYLAGKSAAEV